MKRFFTLLIALLSISSMYANDYLYIEDFEISHDRLYKVVPIRAHFDDYVSGIQLDLTLPEGLTISHAEPSSDLYIDHLDSDGITVTYYPFVGISRRNTRYLVSSQDMDYDDNGNFAGVAKYAPGDYVFFELTVDVTMDFKGGAIEVKSVCCSGADSRPWVHRCTGCNVTTTTHVSVAGQVPDPEQPTTPYQGYWLVVDNDTINFPRTILVDLHDHKYDDNLFKYHVIIDGVPYGAAHDGVATSLEEVEDNVLIPTSNFDYTLEGGRSYYLTIWNGIPHFVICAPIPEPEQGGADAVNEVVCEKQVASVRYYNINGQELASPNGGIVITVTTYTDGTIESTKTLKR